MKGTVWILLFALLSCKQHRSVDAIDSLAKRKSDSAKFARDIQAASDSLDKRFKKTSDLNDTIKPFTTDIYVRYIPDSVISLLKSKLPEWKLPPLDSWERFWFKEYKKDTTLVDYISDDFNGDSKKDYAFILVNDKDSELAVWVLQSQSDDYEAIKIHDLGKWQRASTLETGLEIMPKGKLSYIDLVTENVKTIHIPNPGIGVLKFESASVTYYWQNGRFKSVITGD